MSPAYGTETRKQALLADVRAQGPAYDQALTQKVIEKDPKQVAEDFCLHPALLSLLPVLGGYGADDDGRAFYVDALEALPVGGDPLPAIRRWFLAAWSHPTYGISGRLKGTPMMEAGQALVDLVERSVDHPVDRQTWRRARSALMAAFDGADQAQDLADPVLSMAWDLDQTPGAASDVANGWGGPVMWKAHEEDSDQFSEAENTELMTAMGQFNQKAMASVGEIRQDDPEQIKAFQAAVDALWAAAPHLQALRQRSSDKRARAQAKYAAWRSEARSALLDCLRTTPIMTA